VCSSERKFAMINISKTETTHAGKRLLKGQPPNHELTKLRLYLPRTCSPFLKYIRKQLQQEKSGEPGKYLIHRVMK